MDELELAKIWKALFYCMWHADKPAVQNELAEKLGSLVHAVPGSRAALFAKAFWAMIMREWPGIDRLRCARPDCSLALARCLPTTSDPRRINKFYTLLRCMLRNSLRQLRQASWPMGGAEAFADVLWRGCMWRRGTRRGPPQPPMHAAADARRVSHLAEGREPGALAAHAIHDRRAVQARSAEPRLAGEPALLAGRQHGAGAGRRARRRYSQQCCVQVRPDTRRQG